MATTVSIAAVPDHVAGDEFTEAMWTSLEVNINQGIVEQVGVQAVRNATIANIADSTLQTVTMDTGVKDVYGMWDGAQQLTAPVQGWYAWSALAQWAACAVSKSVEIHVLVNGASQMIIGQATNNDNTHPTYAHGGGDLYLNAGDAVKFQVLQRTGAALTLTSFTGSLVRA